jgi:hypothetical protein
MNIHKKGKLGNQYIIIEITNEYEWDNIAYIKPKNFKKKDVILNVKNRLGVVKMRFPITQEQIQQFL